MANKSIPGTLPLQIKASVPELPLCHERASSHYCAAQCYRWRSYRSCGYAEETTVDVFGSVDYSDPTAILLKAKLQLSQLG